MNPRRLIALLPLVLAACAVGPAYQRPDVSVPAGYKEAEPGWQPAAPAEVDRGAWWTWFGDPLLNDLADQVAVSNQNIAAAVANYAQAQALVRVQRASLFPSVDLNAGATRAARVGGGVANNAQLSLGASWEPDVWGRLSNSVDAATASAQATAADLASARLAAQGELATNYFSLRAADAALALLRTTVEGYERSQQIAQNRYAAGIATKSDVLQAQTQLANARADTLGVQNQRAQLEHAIALLLGKAPADFSLPAVADWKPQTAQVPLLLPSTLLQRRPDIAAFERDVAAANAQIGIQRAAYFPSVQLSGAYGRSSSSVSNLFNASNTLWSLGLSVAQVLFDAGATKARVEGAEAARDVAIARYRQTVLAAFQSVEDQLSTSRTLAAQETLRREASAAADDVERQVLNRYRAGQVSYTEVVIAQVSAFNARRDLLQLQANQQTTAVALILALGGGWQADSAN
ncbi:MAG TPA: efflux transporter outer membrane subunit [Rhizobacter sp.]|nr:efflux transporter outer membrane subunit [Rhizobacter sp.]